MIIAVPFTTLSAGYGNKSLWFNAAMYVDLWGPAAFGLLLGFTKQFTAIEEITKKTKTSYAVFTDREKAGGNIQIQGIFHDPSGASKSPVPYKTAEKALQASLEMPWITETPIRNHVFVRSDWYWGFESGNTHVYPVGATVRLAYPASEPLSAFNGEYEVRPLSEKNPFGAFAFNGSWTSDQEFTWV